MRRSRNFHVHLSGRAVSLATLLSPLRATGSHCVSDPPELGIACKGRRGVCVKAGWSFQDLSIVSGGQQLPSEGNSELLCYV